MLPENITHEKLFALYKEVVDTNNTESLQQLIQNYPHGKLIDSILPYAYLHQPEAAKLLLTLYLDFSSEALEQTANMCVIKQDVDGIIRLLANRNNQWFHWIPGVLNKLIQFQAPVDKVFKIYEICDDNFNFHHEVNSWDVYIRMILHAMQWNAGAILPLLTKYQQKYAWHTKYSSDLGFDYAFTALVEKVAEHHSEYLSMLFTFDPIISEALNKENIWVFRHTSIALEAIKHIKFNGIPITELLQKLKVPNEHHVAVAKYILCFDDIDNHKVLPPLEQSIVSLIHLITDSQLPAKWREFKQYDQPFCDEGWTYYAKYIKPTMPSKRKPEVLQALKDAIRKQIYAYIEELKPGYYTEEDKVDLYDIPNPLQNPRFKEYDTQFFAQHGAEHGLESLIKLGSILRKMEENKENTYLEEILLAILGYFEKDPDGNKYLFISQLADIHEDKIIITAWLEAGYAWRHILLLGQHIEPPILINNYWDFVKKFCHAQIKKQFQNEINQSAAKAEKLLLALSKFSVDPIDSLFTIGQDDFKLWQEFLAKIDSGKVYTEMLAYLQEYGFGECQKREEIMTFYLRHTGDAMLQQELRQLLTPVQSPPALTLDLDRRKNQDENVPAVAATPIKSASIRMGSPQN